MLWAELVGVKQDGAVMFMLFTVVDVQLLSVGALLTLDSRPYS